MKKLLCTLVVMVMALTVLAGCGSSGSSSSGNNPAPPPPPPPSAAIESIIVGLDENFPPMGFRDEQNELTGFDIDLAKEVASRLGMEVTFQPINWDSKELELKGGKVDVLWNGLTITEARRENILFTNPYLANSQVILVSEDSDITGKADLAGKDVGVQKGSSAVEAIEADEATAATLSLKEYENNTEACTDLEIGRISAVVLDEIVARYYSTLKPGLFKVLDENFGSEEYGIGTRLEDTELNGKIQKALDEMIADGKAAEISKKWFGEDKLLK